MTAYLDELARRLVAIDTTSDRSNAEAAELLADRLDAIGFRTSLHRYERDGVAKTNVVAAVGPAEPDGFLVTGHVDAVPFDGQPGWERDPLRLEIGEERVYGRGTSDMKVFVAQSVEAARSLDLGRLRRPLVFAFTADEEIACHGADRLVDDLERILDVPLPRLGWIGEPTSWDVFHAHKGTGLFEVRVRGRGGHSGRPESGVNAIAVTARVIAELGRVQDKWRARVGFAEVFPESPYSTLNLGTIHGGTAGNMIAEECRLLVSFRSLPDRDAGEVYEELAARIRSAGARDWLGAGGEAAVEVRPPLLVPPVLAARGTALETALREVVGRTPTRGALFVADGCRFQRLGVTTLICGPGDFGEAHQPNESISRAGYETGTDVIMRVVEKLLTV